MSTNKSRPTNGASGWLQTFVVTGSLAATVMGAGMIARMESFTANTLADDTTGLDSEPLALDPIPTIMDPTTANSVAILPTATPTDEQQPASAAVIPTDTAEPTYTPTPAPTATPVVRQQTQSTQQFPTTVRRRSRSSR